VRHVDHQVAPTSSAISRILAKFTRRGYGRVAGDEHQRLELAALRATVS
jgi:hypothetical protein